VRFVAWGPFRRLRYARERTWVHASTCIDVVWLRVMVARLCEGSYVNWVKRFLTRGPPARRTLTLTPTPPFAPTLPITLKRWDLALQLRRDVRVSKASEGYDFGAMPPWKVNWDGPPAVLIGMGPHSQVYARPRSAGPQRKNWDGPPSQLRIWVSSIGSQRRSTLMKPSSDPPYGLW